jgi:hypothetical protein
MTTFTIAEDHLKLLRNAYVSWCDDETGAPQIDPKRPYGNSYVEGDIAEILGWKVGEELTDQQREKAMQLHYGTWIALQIILGLLPDVKGTYEKQEEYNDRSWRLVK